MYRILDSRRQFQVFQYLRQLLVLETGCYYGLEYLVIFYLEYYMIIDVPAFSILLSIGWFLKIISPVLPSRVIFGIHAEHLDLASALLILGLSRLASTSVSFAFLRTRRSALPIPLPRWSLSYSRLCKRIH